MKTKRFEISVKVYDDNGDFVEEKTGASLELTPDDGKCFLDTRNGEKIIRQDNGQGAVIEIPQELLEFYEEVEI